jgi:4-oxalocrotonate tautomerase family enzyme
MVLINVKLPSGIVAKEQKIKFLKEITEVAAKNLDVPIESIAISIDDSMPYENVMVGGKTHVKPLSESLSEVFTTNSEILVGMEELETAIKKIKTIKEQEEDDVIIDGLKNGKAKEEETATEKETPGDKVDKVLENVGETLSELASTLSEKLNSVSSKISDMLDDHFKK